MTGRGRARAIAVLLVMLPVAACAGASEMTGGGPVVVGADREDPVTVFARTNGFEDLERASVRIGAVDVGAVVAATPAAHERGLQGVDDVPEGVGMLFVFSGPPTTQARPGFWMLGAVVALDIAFASEGTVVGVATMQPCDVRPCPITHPGVDYDVALEVAAGALARAGVGPGDRLIWERIAP